MVTLKNEKGNYSITLPTSLNEVNMADILKLVENVQLNEHYSIIALMQKFTPMNLALLGGRSDKEAVVSVTPIFIRSNDPNNKIKANLGDKVISSRSDFERAIHLPMKSGISYSTVLQTMEDNPNIRTALRKDLMDDKGNPVTSILCAEFKIVPLTSIYAIIDKSIKIEDNFIKYSVED